MLISTSSYLHIAFVNLTSITSLQSERSNASEHCSRQPSPHGLPSSLQATRRTWEGHNGGSVPSTSGRRPRRRERRRGRTREVLHGDVIPGKSWAQAGVADELARVEEDAVGGQIRVLGWDAEVGGLSEEHKGIAVRNVAYGW